MSRSVEDQDRIPASARIAYGVLGISLFVIGFVFHPIFIFIGLALVLGGLNGRHGKVEVLGRIKCPECRSRMEIYKQVVSEERIQPGLLSTATITQTITKVRCTVCSYENKYKDYEDNQQRKKLRQQLDLELAVSPLQSSRSASQKTETITNSIDADSMAASTKGTSVEATSTQHCVEDKEGAIEERMEELNKELERKRLKAKIDNKRGTKEAHPDTARLIYEYGTTCPSCGKVSSLQFRRWIRRVVQPLSRPIVLESQSYVKCNGCSYLVSVNKFKSHKKKQKQQQQQQQQP